MSKLHYFVQRQPEDQHKPGLGGHLRVFTLTRPEFKDPNSELARRMTPTRNKLGLFEVVLPRPQTKTYDAVTAAITKLDAEAAIHRAEVKEPEEAISVYSNFSKHYKDGVRQDAHRLHQLITTGMQDEAKKNQWHAQQQALKNANKKLQGALKDALNNKAIDYADFINEYSNKLDHIQNEINKLSSDAANPRQVTITGTTTKKKWQSFRDKYSADAKTHCSLELKNDEKDKLQFVNKGTDEVVIDLAFDESAEKVSVSIYKAATTSQIEAVVEHLVALSRANEDAALTINVKSDQDVNVVLELLHLMVIKGAPSVELGGIAESKFTQAGYSLEAIKFAISETDKDNWSFDNFKTYLSVDEDDHEHEFESDPGPTY